MAISKLVLKPCKLSKLTTPTQPQPPTPLQPTPIQTPLPFLTPSNPTPWIEQFRDISSYNQCHALYWFWDHFNWTTQSLWVGKFNKMNHLPQKNEQITTFMQKLIKDLNENPALKSQIYIKFYFSRNIKSNEPDLNYLMICNGPHLPEDFKETLVDIVFEKYPLNEALVNKDENCKRLIDHYISWNNFYTYYDLMGEMQF